MQPYTLKMSPRYTLLLLLRFWRSAEKSCIDGWIVFYKALRSAIYSLMLLLLTYHDLTNLYRKKATKSTIFIKYFKRKLDFRKIFC
jgi:hypothetical protein